MPKASDDVDGAWGDRLSFPQQHHLPVAYTGTFYANQGHELHLAPATKDAIEYEKDSSWAGASRYVVVSELVLVGARRREQSLPDCVPL